MIKSWWDFGSQTDYDLDDVIFSGWVVTFKRILADNDTYKTRVEAGRNGATVWAEDQKTAKALSQVKELTRVRETFP